MNNKTIDALVSYVILLINNEGFDAIHTSQLIPTYQLGAEKTWTQFPQLGMFNSVVLNQHRITYDQPSGWFRRVK